MIQLANGNRVTSELSIHFNDGSVHQETTVFSTLLGDIDPKAPKTVVSMLVATPKPRLVKLELSPFGEDSFSIGGSATKAMRYAVKVDLGGISGVIAPIIGKQPPDIHVWMVGGKAPGFLKSEGPLFQDGPVWPKPSSGQKR